MTNQELRLKCLEIASKTSPAYNEIIARANNFIEFVGSDKEKKETPSGVAELHKSAASKKADNPKVLP